MRVAISVVFSCLLSCGAASAQSSGDDPLKTRVDLKEVSRLSSGAKRVGTREGSKVVAGQAFGDGAGKDGGAGLRGRGVDPGDMAPGTPASAGGAITDVEDKTPYAQDIAKVRAVIENNAGLLEGAAKAKQRGFGSFVTRTNAITTMIVGVIIAITGAAIAKASGQTLQGQLITAIGAFLGALALSLLAGGSPSPDTIQDDVRFAGYEQRKQIRDNFSKASARDKIYDPDWDKE